jgi:copper chaperone CopZ
VTDLSGKVVYTTDLGTVNGTQDVQVNTSSFTSGVYMVNVSVDGAVTTQKLVVRK